MSEEGGEYQQDLVSIGYITKTHGVKGDVKIVPLTDIPGRFNSIEKVYIYTKQGVKMEYCIDSVKSIKGGVVLSFVPPISITEGEALVGGYLKVPADEVPLLEQDNYYQFEIIGIEVFTEDGRYLGRIEEIFSTGSNDVYVVKDGDTEYLIPAVSYVVKKVDTKEKRMIIAMIEGLL